MEGFELQIEYKGEVLTLPARLIVQGYTHKIAVEVFGTEVLFEPDEERNYRAIISEEHAQKLPDLQLLKMIAEEIERQAK
ncbi:MAG: hypothetical protein EOP56_11285 [Sphingobacteriales bacterium]|nr:MAG: hypothetical protein EOP56_11285 [Sphingobacteriales bacterium]